MCVQVIPDGKTPEIEWLDDTPSSIQNKDAILWGRPFTLDSPEPF